MPLKRFLRSRISTLATLILLSCTFGSNAQTLQERMLIQNISATTSAKDQIEFIDSSIAKVFFSSSSQNVLDQVAQARARACFKAATACTAIEHWSGVLCQNQLVGYQDSFFNSLWHSVFLALSSESNAKILWEKIKKCSQFSSVGQTYAALNLMLLANAKSWHHLESSIVVWMEQSAGKVPGGNFVQSLNVILEVMEPPAKGPPKSIAPRLAAANLSLAWMKSKRKLPVDVEARWLNTVVDFYASVGMSAKATAAINIAFDKVNSEDKTLNRYLMGREYCNAEREQGNFQSCSNMINKIYKSNPDFEGQIELARNLFEQGRFKESKSAFSTLSSKAKEFPGWKAWIPFFIGLSQMYLGEFAGATESLESHLKLLGSMPPLAKSSSVIYRLKMLRFQKRFGDAWSEVEASRSLFDQLPQGPWRQRLVFDYESLLVAVGLQDKSKIKNCLIKVKNDFVGDPSEAFRHLAIQIIEKRLINQPTENEVTKLGAIKGVNHPEVIDIKNVLQ